MPERLVVFTELGTERVPARHWQHDVHENAPEHPLLAGRTTAQSGTHAVTFGSGLATEEEAKHQALGRAQRADWIWHPPPRYYEFTHPNDTDKERKEKEGIAQKYKALRGNRLYPGTGSLTPDNNTSLTQEYKSQEIEEYFSENFVSPKAWRNVLDSTVAGQKLRDLHLCLAHFGGPTEQGREWSDQIIDMMTKYPNFYADISSSFASGTFRKHFKKIIQTNKDREIIKKRVLFGTDWYMTLLYTKPFHGMDYWEYCTKTKDFLDEIDTSLWPRFTMHNPYRFYRLTDQVPRIAGSIIARRQTEELEEKNKSTIKEDKNTKIHKDAAWIRQANDGFGI